MPSVPIERRTAYLEALKGKWDNLVVYYCQEGSEQMQFPITLAGDNALHIAAYSQGKKPLDRLLNMVDEESGAYIHPSPVTIKNYIGNTPLHEAVLTNNFEAVKLLATRCPELRTTVNDMEETPLFLAAEYSDIKIVGCLALTEDKDSRSQPTAGQQGLLPEIHRKRADNTSILHVAVQGGRFETALLLLNLDESLKDLKDSEGKTALYYLSAMPSAFKSGYSMNIFTKFLYFLAPVEDDYYTKKVKTTAREPCWFYSGENCSSCFNKQDIEGGQSRNPQNRHYCRSIYSYVHKVLQAIHRLLWTCLLRGWPFFKELYDSKKRHGFALRFAKLLIEDDFSWYDVSTELYLQELKEVEKENKEIPLFIATRNGVLEIVEEILTQHPMAIDEFVNAKGQNILHLSVLHRHRDIFDLVMSVSKPRARLRRRIDNSGYTLLHQVADNAYCPTESGLGPAFQLQSELKLFESVRASIPSHYEMLRDKNYKKTAEELFEKNQQVHLTRARTWVKDTCQSSSTIAVLVAGVVFAAGFTVPGGSDSTGTPNHLCSKYFMVFVIMDVISLASSLTSVVMFLSAITSPLGLKDFHKSIPRKLMLGFALLFFSVMTTMVAFGAAIFILLQSEKHWTNWLIYIAAFCPILVFAVVQFHMYVAFGSVMLDYLQTVAHSLIPGYAAFSRRAETFFRKNLFN